MPWVMQIWSWTIPLIQPILSGLLVWSVYRQRTWQQARWFVVYCWANAAQATLAALASWIDADWTYYVDRGLEPLTLGPALCAIYEVFGLTATGQKRNRDWFLRWNAGYLVGASLLAMGIHDFNQWKLLRVIHTLGLAIRMVELALLAHLLILILVFGFYVRRLPLAIVLGIGANAAASLAGTYILTVYGYSHFSSAALLGIIAYVFAIIVWMVAVWTQPNEATRLASARPDSPVDWAPAMRELSGFDGGGKEDDSPKPRR